MLHYGTRGQTIGSRRSVSNDIRPVRLLGSKTIRVAQGFALFQSPRDSCGEPDLTGNGLAAVAPALNDKFYTPLKRSPGGGHKTVKRVTF